MLCYTMPWEVFVSYAILHEGTCYAMLTEGKCYTMLNEATCYAHTGKFRVSVRGRVWIGVRVMSLRMTDPYVYHLILKLPDEG